MITDGKKLHYLIVKSFSALLKGITSNHNGNFYCLNCFRSYSTKEKLKKHEKVCNGDDYCYVEMPNDNNKVLKYDHGEKSFRVPFVIYAELKCLLEKMRSCQNNPEKSYTEKKLSIHLLAIHCLQIVHLIRPKITPIVTEVKIVWKGFVRT